MIRSFVRCALHTFLVFSNVHTLPCCVVDRMSVDEFINVKANKHCASVWQRADRPAGPRCLVFAKDRWQKITAMYNHSLHACAPFLLRALGAAVPMCVTSSPTCAENSTSMSSQVSRGPETEALIWPPYVIGNLSIVLYHDHSFASDDPSEQIMTLQKSFSYPL